ncbi:hypothetical protein NW754_003752 [Fusarium falciforme]|nr:hypothetical protein NW754_003752 [Fusarium falciforme]
MSSQQQKGSTRDLWELPKIPQWSPERKIDEWYDVEDDAFTRGGSHYASLLGIKIQGLDSSSADQQYDFTVKSSYMDLKCVYAGRRDSEDRITPGGSSLDGPDRARKLRDLRLQLTDVRPESETGYIAVRAVPSAQDENEQESKMEWRPLDRKKLYA